VWLVVTPKLTTGSEIAQRNCRRRLGGQVS
jgi:hypothetical protein